MFRFQYIRHVVRDRNIQPIGYIAETEVENVLDYCSIISVDETFSLANIRMMSSDRSKSRKISNVNPLQFDYQSTLKVYIAYTNSFHKPYVGPEIYK